MTGLLEKYGPWAIVAGASEGTGQEFARGLAAEGVNLVLIARRKALLDALAGELTGKHGIECVTACVDLGAESAASEIISAAGDREIGLFVSNAGSDPNASRFLECDIGAWEQLVRMNSITMMRCCHHFGKAMCARGRGGLLLVNSAACYVGASKLVTYSASKAFMLNFCEGLWAEFRPHGVDVLTLVLSNTDTPFYRRYMADLGLPFPEDAASPAEVARVGLQRLPHGPIHNWGHADDQAGFSALSAAQLRDRVMMIDDSRRTVLAASLGTSAE